MDIPTEAWGKTELSGFAKDLLNQLQTKQITLDEFMRRYAYWALQAGFDELRPRQKPHRPDTRAWTEYYGMTPNERGKLLSSYFDRNPEIPDYYQRLRKVSQWNKDTKAWLLEIKRHITQEDAQNNEKLDNRLSEFVEDPQDETVLRAQEVFDGEVLR